MQEEASRAGGGLFQLAFLAAIAVGALLRWVALGHEPLSGAEASSSLAAWRAAMDEASAFGGSPSRPLSAALYGVQYLGFWLTGGGGDALARFGPALFGSALIFAPWLLRRQLGSTGALALAWLLALDPWLVGFSRVADGAIVAVAGAWLVVIAALQRRASVPADLPTQSALPAERSIGSLPRATAASAVGCALLVTSGPLGWDLLVPSAALLAVTLPRRPETGGGSRRREHGAFGPFVWLGATAVTVILLSSSVLLQWNGPGLVSTGLTAWLAEWSLAPTAGASLRSLLGRIAAHEHLLLGLGLAGLGSVLSWPRRRPEEGRQETQASGRRPELDGRPFGGGLPPAILVGWLVWGGVVLLRSRGAPDSWLVAQVPLLLAAAVAAGRLFAARRRILSRPHAVFLALVSVLCAAGLVLSVRGSLRIASPATLSSWRPFVDRGLSGARDLASDVERLASIRRGEGSRAGVRIVDPGASAPVLAWYLRGARLQWSGSPAGPDTESRLRVEPAPMPEGEDELAERGLYPVRESAFGLEAFHLQVSYSSPLFSSR